MHIYISSVHLLKSNEADSNHQKEGKCGKFAGSHGTVKILKQSCAKEYMLYLCTPILPCKATPKL